MMRSQARAAHAVVGPNLHSLMNLQERSVHHDLFADQPTLTASLRLRATQREEVISLSELPGVLGMHESCTVGAPEVSVRFVNAEAAQALLYRLEHSAEDTLLVGGDEHPCLNFEDVEEAGDEPLLDNWHLEVHDFEVLAGGDGAYVVKFRGQPKSWMEMFSQFDMKYRMDPKMLPDLPEDPQKDYDPYEGNELAREHFVNRANTYYYKNTLNLINFNRDSSGNVVKRNMTIFATSPTVTAIYNILNNQEVYPKGDMAFYCVECYAYVRIGLQFDLSYTFTVLKGLKIESYQNRAIYDSGLNILFHAIMDLEYALPLLAIRIPKKGQELGTIAIPLGTGVSLKITPKVALEFRLEIVAKAYVELQAGFLLKRYVERGASYSGYYNKWTRKAADVQRSATATFKALQVTGSITPQLALAPVVLFKVGLNVLLEVASVTFEVVVPPYIRFEMTFPGTDSCAGRRGQYDISLGIDVEFSISKVTVLGINLANFIPLIPYTFKWEEVYVKPFTELGCSKCAGCLSLQSAEQRVDYRLAAPEHPKLLPTGMKFDYHSSFCADNNLLPAGSPGPASKPNRCQLCGEFADQVVPSGGGCAFCPDTQLCFAFPNASDPNWTGLPLGNVSCPSNWVPASFDPSPYYWSSIACPAEDYPAPFNLTVFGNDTGYCVAEENCTISWTFDSGAYYTEFYVQLAWVFADSASVQSLIAGELQLDALPGQGLPTDLVTAYADYQAYSDYSISFVPSTLLASRTANGEKLWLTFRARNGLEVQASVTYDIVQRFYVVSGGAPPAEAFVWVYSHWGPCSYSCGNNTFHNRTATCYDVTTGLPAEGGSASCLSALDPLTEPCAYVECAPTPLEGVLQPAVGSAVNTYAPATDWLPQSDFVDPNEWLSTNDTLPPGAATSGGVAARHLSEFEQRRRRMMRAAVQPDAFNPIVTIEWGGGTGDARCMVMLQCLEPVFNMTLSSDVACGSHTLLWDTTTLPVPSAEGCRRGNVVIEDLEFPGVSVAVVNDLVVHVPANYSMKLTFERRCEGTFTAYVTGPLGGVAFDFDGQAGTDQTLVHQGRVASLYPVLGLTLTADIDCAYTRVLTATMSDAARGELFEFGVFAEPVLKTGTFAPGTTLYGIDENGNEISTLLIVQAPTCSGPEGCAARRACNGIDTQEYCDQTVGCGFVTGSCIVQEKSYEWNYPRFTSSSNDLKDFLF